MFIGWMYITNVNMCMYEIKLSLHWNGCLYGCVYLCCISRCPINRYIPLYNLRALMMQQVPYKPVCNTHIQNSKAGGQLIWRIIEVWSLKTGWYLHYLSSFVHTVQRVIFHIRRHRFTPSVLPNRGVKGLHQIKGWCLKKCDWASILKKV